MTIISKYAVRKIFETMSSTKKPSVAVRLTAEKTGLSEDQVRAIVNESSSGAVSVAPVKTVDKVVRKVEPQRQAGQSTWLSSLGTFP